MNRPRNAKELGRALTVFVLLAIVGGALVALASQRLSRFGSAAFMGEMVFVPAGTFVMGSEIGREDEKPVREVYLDAFWDGSFSC